MSWEDVYGTISQMLNEAYEMGQMDVRQGLIRKMDKVQPNDSFTKSEIIKYLNEIGKEDRHDEDADT